MTDRDRGVEHIFDDVSIPIAYKMGYITNHYREPSFRAIEAEHGLTRPETLVLIFLAVMDGSTAGQICQHSGHLKTNISRAVIALQAKGLVRRSASAQDLRRQHLHITAKGRALHGKFMPKLNAREQAMISCLSQAERAMFEELLRKICKHMPRWSDEPF